MTDLAVTPEQAGHETRAAIVNLASRFMTDAATYAHGAELGFEGMDFYASGRGGVLGEVPADVAAAAFVYFELELVRSVWERSALVMPRRRAAEEWAGCCHTWAREHLPEAFDWPTLAALVGRVSDAAPVAAAPLFAGWRLLPEPGDPRELAMHRLNGLRELRGAMHGAAVLTSVGRSRRRAPTACSAAASRCSMPTSGARSWSCSVRSNRDLAPGTFHLGTRRSNHLRRRVRALSGCARALR